MNQTFQKIVGGVLAVTALMGLSACGSKTEDNKAEGKTYKVGIVQFVDDASLNQIEAAIEAELDAKATELGVTFDYTLYNGQGDATTLNQIGAELVGKGVDLIVPIATPAVKIMQSVTEDTEIPIVFSAVSDPVGAGIVDSLDAPGGRITGTSDALNTKGLLDLMLAQNPDTKTVGLLYSKSEDSSKQPIEDAKAYLEGKGIRCVEKTGTTTDEVTSAVDALIAEHDAAPHLRVLQKRLAEEITCMIHSHEEYEKAVEASAILFGGATSEALHRLDEQTLLQVFEGVPQYRVARTELAAGIPFVDLCAEKSDIFASKGECRKLVQGGGVSLNKEKLADAMRPVTDADLIAGKYLLVQRGKKNYYLVIAE